MAPEPNRKPRGYVDQQAFARNPPTEEDLYFQEEERKRSRPKPVETAARPAGPPKPPTLFERLYRAIARSFNSDWRP